MKARSWLLECNYCMKSGSPDTLRRIEEVLENQKELTNLKDYIDGLSEESSPLTSEEYLNIGDILTEIFSFFHRNHYSSCKKLPLTNLIDQMKLFGLANNELQRDFEMVCFRLTKLRELIFETKKTEEKNFEKTELLNIKITYRESSILSTEEEDLFLSGLNRDLLPHRVKGSYISWNLYANNMFYFLKEDMFMDLRVVMKELREKGIDNYSNEASQIVFVYERTIVKNLVFKRGGTFLTISVWPSISKRKMNINWGNTKRLITGTLVLICSRNFDYITFATVSEKPDDNVMNRTYEMKGCINILVQVKGSSSGTFTNYEKLFSNEFILIETKNYFEAYNHFLSRIKTMPLENLPFKTFIIDAKSEPIPPPNYLSKENEEYLIDLNSGRNTFLLKQNIKILETWPPNFRGTLDPHQIMALQNMLTKQLSLIQGPPGTGKTFVGALGVKILLQNKKLNFKTSIYSPGPRFKGPILIICQTNHALDQFLRHINQLTDSIVRVGGRISQPELVKFSLKEIKKKVNSLKSVEQ